MKNKLLTFFVLCSFLLPSITLGYSTGALDTTFNSGLVAGSGATGVYLQSDNKMIIVGDFETYSGVSRNRIARVNTDGTLDTTFNPGQGANASISTAAIQADGKILIGGNFTSYNGVSRNRIARVNTDGTLDTTFNPGQGLNGEVRTISIQTDGKVIIGGYFTTFDNDIAQNNILRLNADGSLDSGFASGTGATSVVDMYPGIVYASLIQPDGKILIAGNFNKYNDVVKKGIARINTDGSVDTSFEPGVGPDNLGIISLARQTDGKILIGGIFSTYAGVSRKSIARINTDGTLDTSFDPGAGVEGEVHSVSLQTDGKIILGGYFTKYNNINRKSIARVNTNGTLDTTFDSGTGTNSVVLGVAHQPDTKILIAGRFTTYNDISRPHLARLGDTVSNPPVPNTTPTPTTQADMTNATDTGTSNTDNITGDNTPDFITLCISGSLVKLYVDGVALSNTATCTNGTATITPVNPLSTSTHNITYTQTVSGIESGQAPVLSIIVSNDDTGPLINGVTNIGQNASTTPSYTFTSNEAGTIVYGGACSSNTLQAHYGFNTVVFKPLSNGVYTNCTIKVIDAVGNMSNILTISSFTVTQGTNSQNNSTVSTEGCTAFTAYSPITGAKCPAVASNGQTTFVDTNPVLCPHFTQYVKLNSKTNDTNEVKRWQAFLNQHMGAGLTLDGKFGRLSFNAVKNFQARYFDDILAPWGITEPTGYAYKSTRAKANKIFGCSEGVVMLDNGASVQ